MVIVTSGAERDTGSGTPELSVSGLTVRFGALTALERVSLADLAARFGAAILEEMLHRIGQRHFGVAGGEACTSA